MGCEKMMGKRARALCAAILFFVTMAIGFSACGNGEEPEGSTAPKGSQPVQTEQTVNPLTGLSGFREAAVGHRPVAVMINNAPAARPQWGLCSPDIVLEGLAEGGITRMMWLFADVQSIPKIGSVRSARHDFWR